MVRYYKDGSDYPGRPAEVEWDSPLRITENGDECPAVPATKAEEKKAYAEIRGQARKYPGRS